MRIAMGASALVLAVTFVAACSGTAATPEPTEAPASPTGEPSAAPTADPCAPASLATLTAGTLTLGADNPAYPPYFEPSATNPDPWELGDPTNGQGFEGAVAAALAAEMGYEAGQVAWVVTPFGTAIQPGPKAFDVYITQVSYTAERAEAVDLSDGYYDVAQSVVAVAGTPIASVTTIAGLKDFTFGAQVGTTSLEVITEVIAPTKDPQVFDTNDAAVEALKNGQIDAIVVDLPTAFYVTAVQLDAGAIVGQFPTEPGGEYFSLVLDKESTLTPCVNAALGRLREAGTLDAITQEWLADKANAPVLQP